MARAYGRFDDGFLCSYGIIYEGGKACGNKGGEGKWDDAVSYFLMIPIEATYNNAKLN
jgi:hypothetical protein